MAWTFSEQIHALTGFDAASNSDSETGEDFRVLSAQWLTDAAREVMNLFPLQMLERCTKLGSAFAPTTGEAHDNKIISVIRAKTTDFTTGEVYVCRQINHVSAHKAADINGLSYATETDPVWYYEPQTDGTNVKIKVLPASSSAISKINSIDYPSIAYGDTSISNFPDEAEYLVPLRAAITAAEYQLAIEEDTEIYVPIIASLKLQYEQAVLALQTRKLYKPKKKKDKDDDED